MSTWVSRRSGVVTPPGLGWLGYAARMAAAGMVLAGALAACSGQPAATRDPATSCYQFVARAIQHHVTLTTVPAACQGLSQVEVNVAVSRALRSAASGAHGKVRQRRIIARDSRYVAGLLRTIPASSQPAVGASPSALPGQPAVAAPSSRSPSRGALSVAALIAWLVTVGLGLSMLARWITRAVRPGPRARPGQGPALNFAHLGLALTGLLAWIGYLITGVTGLAWGACGLLLAAASLGMALVFLAPAASDATTRAGDDQPPVGRPPILIIAVHITSACVTILLATLAAIGSG